MDIKEDLEYYFSEQLDKHNKTHCHTNRGLAWICNKIWQPCTLSIKLVHKDAQVKYRVGTTTKLWQQILQGVQELFDHSELPYAKERVGLYWDTTPNYKDFQEKDVCECLARSLSDQGMGNIREIRKYHHPDDSDKDFPDCLANMDGKIRYKEWTPEQFRERIIEIVERKNKAAQQLGREELLESLARISHQVKDWL